MADSHTYTDEYRRECADLVIASGRPATQMADEIGVNRKTLQHWVQRRKMELEGAMPTADPELKAARKRIRELEMAWRRGYVAENAIFHSDTQYTSRLVGAWAADHQVRLSVGRTGSCHGNAVAEGLCA